MIENLAYHTQDNVKVNKSTRIAWWYFRVFCTELVGHIIKISNNKTKDFQQSNTTQLIHSYTNPTETTLNDVTNLSGVWVSRRWRWILFSSEVWHIGTDLLEDGGTFRMEERSSRKLSLTQRDRKQQVLPKWWCLSIKTFTITIVVALKTYMKSM